jgi:hypothetical protein
MTPSSEGASAWKADALFVGTVQVSTQENTKSLQEQHGEW